MFNKFLRLFIYGTIILGLYIAFHGIWVRYSYWWDELYSVASASQSWHFMFNEFILQDVHPPLYLIVLKLWIGIFSNSEPVTRSLSLIFSFGSLIVFYLGLRKYLSKDVMLFIIAFIATNSVFIYWSQETRSNTMMLFMSSIITVFFLRYILNNSSKNLYVLLFFVFLGSLTHYFALIYGGLILAYIFLTNLFDIKNNLTYLIAISFTGILSLIWPIYNLFFSGLNERLGGNFWIQSDGWYSTISVISSALTRQINITFNVIFNLFNVNLSSSNSVIVALIFIFMIIIIVVIRGNFTDEKSNNENHLNLFKPMLYVFISFIVVLIAIDYYSPLSIMRSYIVLLPSFYLILALSLDEFKRVNESLVLLFVIGFTLSSIILTIFVYGISINGRSVAQNHASSVRFIVNNKDFESSIYITRHQPIHVEMARFYFDFYGSSIEIDTIEIENLKSHDFNSNSFILLQHINVATKEEIILSLSETEINFEIYVPEMQRGHPGSSMVIWIKTPNNDE